VGQGIGTAELAGTLARIIYLPPVTSSANK